MVSSVVGIPDRQIVYKANRQQNHSGSGIVSNKKVMKAARDFCSSLCNKGSEGYYLYLVHSHVVVVVHCL